MEFDKIVQKMRKKGQKLWSLRDIERYTEEQKAKSKKQKVYRIIHRLIATGVLTSIHKGMYLWNMEGILDPEEFYWQLVKKIIAENYLGQGIITGAKALGFGIKDYSLSQTLSIIVPGDSKKITIIEGYELSTITLNSEKKGLFSIIKKYATRQKIQDIEISIAAPEHALLEAFTTRPGQDVYDSSLMLRWLKKNASTLREAVFAEIIPYKYISATNRLKYFAADNAIQELYEMMIRLIDRYGKGCHLSREFLLGKRSSKIKNKDLE